MLPLLVAAAAGALVLLADDAEAGHYRGGTFHATPTGGNAVRFEGELYFRSSDARFFGSAGGCFTGATFTDINANPDGFPYGEIHTNGATLPFAIRSVACDVPNDVFVGQILDYYTFNAGVPYTYPTPTQGGNPWLAYYESATRQEAVSPGYHVNNPGSGWRLETTVTLGGTPNQPSIPSATPVVTCSVEDICTIPITYTDADSGQAHTFRFATSPEAICQNPSGATPSDPCPGGTFYQPGPGCGLCGGAQASAIGLSSGIFTWDTTGAPLSPTASDRTYYSVHIMVEDGVNKVPLEFYIQFIPGSPKALFTYVTQAPCGPLTLSVDGSGSTTGTGGGSPIVSYEWSWGDASPASFGMTQTHTYAAPGTYTVTLKVTDSSGKWGAKSIGVTIPPTCPPPPLNQPPTGTATIDNTLDTCADTRIVFTATGADPEGQQVSFQWFLSDGHTTTLATFTRVVLPAGNHQATLVITDAGGATKTIVTPFLSHGDPNCCPVLDPLHDITATVGRYIEMQVIAKDPEGDAITYAFSGATPDNAALGTFGDLSWQTEAGDEGSYPITVVASDAGCSDTGTFTITVIPVPVPPPPQDADRDGLQDIADNCPTVSNRDQADLDRDAIGDACDVDVATPAKAPTPPTPPGPGLPDRDGDGIPDVQDNCAALANRDQGDLDRDDLGDACDRDMDGDGILQAGAAGLLLDNCPLASNPGQADTDDDGVGDACAAPAGTASGVAKDAAAPDHGDGLTWQEKVLLVVGPAGLILVVGAAAMLLRRKR